MKILRIFAAEKRKNRHSLSENTIRQKEPSIPKPILLRRRYGSRNLVTTQAVIKIHIGKLTLKLYDKGEPTLRAEVLVHNAKELGCKRSLDTLKRWLLSCKTRLADITLTQRRNVALMESILALMIYPKGFSCGDLKEMMNKKKFRDYSINNAR